MGDEQRSEQVPVLAYHGPDPSSRVWMVPTIIAGAFTALIALKITLVLTFVVPSFEAIFKDFKAELPGSTKILLTVARGNFWMIVWLAPIVVGIIVYALTARQPDRSIRLSYTLLAIIINFFVLMILAALFIYALFAPMIALTQSISGK